ncbi:ribbon-helix-helix domain-containing protein [Bacterioplanoides sp.]|uniref:ribbon-helix-helix domain-containing protein n=1 Tax=Bacterioplanoides sp. TaxID=2066072 RepID=UPI003AFFCC3E
MVSSDYTRDLIRKGQLRNQKVQAMQQAIDEGLSGGTPKPFNSQAFKVRMEEHIKHAEPQSR